MSLTLALILGTIAWLVVAAFLLGACRMAARGDAAIEASRLPTGNPMTTERAPRVHCPPVVAGIEMAGVEIGRGGAATVRLLAMSDSSDGAQDLEARRRGRF